MNTSTVVLAQYAYCQLLIVHEKNVAYAGFTMLPMTDANRSESTLDIILYIIVQQDIDK